MYEAADGLRAALRLVSLAAAREQGELWSLVDQVAAGDSTREALVALSVVAGALAMAEAEHCGDATVDELLMSAFDPAEEVS